MDKLLNNVEQRLQTLLEQKDFSALTDPERRFVLEHMSEGSYSVRRQIIAEAGQMNEESHSAPEHIGLNVMDHLEKDANRRPKVFVLTRKVPLYYSVIAAASVALFMMLLSNVRIEETTVGDTEKQTVTLIDTVYHKITEYDTIVEYVDRPVYIKTKEQRPEKTVETAAKTVVRNEPSGDAVLQSQVNIPDIEKLSLVNKGSSYSEDHFSIPYENNSPFGLKEP